MDETSPWHGLWCTACFVSGVVIVGSIVWAIILLAPLWIGGGA